MHIASSDARVSLCWSILILQLEDRLVFELQQDSSMSQSVRK